MVLGLGLGGQRLAQRIPRSRPPPERESRRGSVARPRSTFPWGIATGARSVGERRDAFWIEVALALVMMGALDGYVDRKRALTPGYLASRFVLDAAKLAGFEGI